MRLTPNEVGRVPADWSVRSLGEICERVTNGFVGVATPYYVEEGAGVRYLLGTNIRSNQITSRNKTFVHNDFSKKNAKSILKLGDLLTVQSGHIGVTAVVPQSLAGSNCHALIISRLRQNVGHPEYVSQYLNSPLGQLRLKGLHVGSSIPHINTSELAKFKIPLPPLAEQRRIAEVLSNSDQMIANMESQLADRQNWVEIFKEALLSGKRRYVDYPPWQPRSLSQMIRESRVIGSRGNSAKKITVKLYGKGVVEKVEKRVGSEATQYYRRSAGQFIYGKLDFLNGAFGRIPASLDGYESTLDLPAFDFLEGVDPRWFLYHVSRDAFYVSHLGLANGGRKARRVNPVDLLRVSILTPCLEEQVRIADAIDVALKEIANQEQQLNLLREEKSALMSQLLTGKRRVKLPISETEAQA